MLFMRNVDSCEIMVDLDLIVTGLVIYFLVITVDANELFGGNGFGLSTSFVIFDTVAVVVDFALTVFPLHAASDDVRFSGFVMVFAMTVNLFFDKRLCSPEMINASNLNSLKFH